MARCNNFSKKNGHNGLKQTLIKKVAKAVYFCFYVLGGCGKLFYIVCLQKVTILLCIFCFLLAIKDTYTQKINLKLQEKYNKKRVKII